MEKLPKWKMLPLRGSLMKQGIGGVGRNRKNREKTRKNEKKREKSRKNGKAILVPGRTQ